MWGLGLKVDGSSIFRGRNWEGPTCEMDMMSSPFIVRGRVCAGQNCKVGMIWAHPKWADEMRTVSGVISVPGF